MDPNWRSDELELRRAFGRVKRHFPSIVLFGLLGFLAGFAFLVLASPKYTAQTTMLLETQTSEIGNVETLFLDLDTHANLITSDAIIARVVRRFDLAEDFAPDSGPVMSALNYTRERFSQPLFGEVRHLDRLVEDAETRAEAVSEAGRVFASVPGIRKNLNVRRNGQTRLLILSFTSDDPELSATIANGFAEVYVEHLQNVGHFGDGAEAVSRDSGTLSVELSTGGARGANSANPGLFDDLRIVSWASVPTTNSSPNVNVVLAVFTVLGLVLGVALAVRSEWAGRK